ncbi:GftB: Glycosyl transferase, family 8 [Staphylococcus aureus]|uniref:GftB: Glycosyl transferase, family 8 n=1 Tax=Staphylococcus aureus TaxID=1280 RepID=A0A380ENU9_STAAU|nr:GftB: Glycosyl transferase, family 8 [Staphylococcus aureus]
MTAEGKEVIYENFVTSDVILDWQGKSYFFPSKLAFALFFIKQLEITEHHFVINSLALPFSVLYICHQKVVMFWYGKNTVMVMSREICN